MFTYSHTFTIIAIIAESTQKLLNNTRNINFGNPLFELKVVTYLPSLILK